MVPERLPAVVPGMRWARAGHEVFMGGRDTTRAAALAERLGGHAGDPRAVAEFGEDAVLVALPSRAAVDVVGGLKDGLRSRTLIDCTNPVGPGFVLETASGPSASARLASAAPGAHVVKAFNLCHADVRRLAPPVFDGRPLAVPLCGDDEKALSAVRHLVRDLGATPERRAAGESGAGGGDGGVVDRVVG